jgi:hypothetical protein
LESILSQPLLLKPHAPKVAEDTASQPKNPGGAASESEPLRFFVAAAG